MICFQCRNQPRESRAHGKRSRQTEGSKRGRIQAPGLESERKQQGHTAPRSLAQLAFPYPEKAEREGNPPVISAASICCHGRVAE